MARPPSPSLGLMQTHHIMHCKQKERTNIAYFVNLSHPCLLLTKWEKGLNFHMDKSKASFHCACPLVGSLGLSPKTFNITLAIDLGEHCSFAHATACAQVAHLCHILMPSCKLRGLVWSVYRLNHCKYQC